MQIHLMQIVSFAIHSFLCITLAKRITQEERFPKPMLYIVSLINGLLSPFLVAFLGINGPLTYIAFTLVIFLELLLLLKDRIWVNFVITFGLMLHLFSLRSIVVSFHSILTEYTMFFITNDPYTLDINTIVTIWVHIIILIAFILLVPPNAVKEIIANKTLLNSIGLLMIVLATFFIYNSSIFYINTKFIEILSQQIILPIFLLGVFYFVLIFMIRLVSADEYKRIIADLEHKNERDSLTEAFNKDGLKNKISAHLNREQTGVLFIFDIDNFKGINDNMGHVYGDKVLIEIYDSLKHVFRSTDLIGRFGGDEFVAFINTDTAFEEISNIATRTCNAINKAYFTEDNKTKVQISASIGIAIAPNDGASYEELFHCADIALYASKSKGKNTYTFYDNNLGFNGQTITTRPN